MQRTLSIGAYGIMRWIIARSGRQRVSDTTFQICITMMADVVEALLPAVLRNEYGVTHKLNLGRPGRPSAPSEGGNLSVMMMEIDSAYWKLSKEDRKILFFRYAESMDYKEISNYLSLGSDDAARMRGNRAVKRLVNKLGGYRPFLDNDFPQPETEEPSEVVEGYDSHNQDEWHDEREEIND